jgi:hypothetical protein
MPRFRPLVVDRLEDRLTPSTTGVAWPDGSHLTLSFVPDGTKVGDSQSNLFATLNAVAPTAVWQREILRAFQAWAGPANLNIGVVADGGQALGTSGVVQGDTRFGDIRISALPLGSSTIITNTQFQWSGTTWSGDVVINSSNLFNTSGAGGSVDLYTAMLDEAGNVLGVVDTQTDVTSGAYYHYVGPKAGINAADTADIQSLYGVRTPDKYDAAASNGTLASASNLGLALTGVSVQGEVSSATDVDYYKFIVPPLTPGVIGLSVQLSTAGLSTLVGNVQVYNPIGQLVGSATATDPLTGNLTLQVSGGGLLGLLGGTYSVRVAGASSDFGIGSYQLTVSYRLSNGTLIGPLTGTVNGLLDLETNLNNLVATAVALPSRLLNGSKPDARFDYTVSASINGGQDVDYYKIQAPTGAGQKLNVMVWGLTPNGLLPKIDVDSASGAVVPSTLLANENGTFSVEVPNVASGGTYYLKVSALSPGNGHDTGNYFLGADFTTQPVTKLTNYASGQFTRPNVPTTQPLSVPKNQLYEFMLAASATAPVDVRMQILDENKTVVFTLDTVAGLPASTEHIYLAAGQYTIRYLAVAAPGTTMPPVDFQSTGQVVSDPIGPRLDTETEAIKDTVPMKRIGVNQKESSIDSRFVDQPYTA